ncbi:sideroflexin-4 isoform X2 [Pteronotus mesoamericanus]|uniref:sideroflexin-4 isoform X2 n=1 Tax=Pteronotus mesoamericanus TaxID=1884717 RepID=UPI0023EB6B62|nr:sideroflexin-4 isoform X2 [Pteronotus parnellii mesoamericanus]
MEPNVRFWITERQSFIQRLLQWTELLDPTNLVISIGKIEKLRQLLLTNEDATVHDLEDHRIREAWKRSLSTVHPDNSKLIPVPFRPAALLPFTAPMLSLCTYSSAFNLINGNASYNRRPYESVLVGAGAIASTTFFALFPHLLLIKYALKNTLLRETLPVVILAQVSALNVLASRSLETMRGIEVMDKEGNVIGYSRKAGAKAVQDTATSRAMLFGTSALIPEVFAHFFKRTQLFVRYPHSLWTLKLSCTILVMGVMVPVSFSVFPNIERIQCSKLEEEIQSATEETELFYNRGV